MGMPPWSWWEGEQGGVLVWAGRLPRGRPSAESECCERAHRRRRADATRPRCPSGHHSCSDKRLADLPHHFRQPGEDELGIEPKHPIPQAPEPPLAPSISASPERVVAAIDLDDQFCLGRDEVNDVLPEDCLPAKRNAESFCTERCPEPALRSSGRNAHLLSPRREKLRALSGAGIPRAHSDLHDAACCRACVPQGAGSVPRRSRAACASPGAAQIVRPSQTGPAVCRVVEPRRAALRHPSEL
jgi:hypothetical protein